MIGKKKKKKVSEKGKKTKEGVYVPIPSLPRPVAKPRRYLMVRVPCLTEYLSLYCVATLCASGSGSGGRYSGTLSSEEGKKKALDPFRTGPIRTDLSGRAEHVALGFSQSGVGIVESGVQPPL